MALEDVHAGKPPFAGGLGETPKLGADENLALISAEMTPYEMKLQSSDALGDALAGGTV